MRVNLGELIFERNDGLAGSCITLAPAAPKQLPIDATGLVQFSCDHMQATEFQRLRRESDIGSSAGHVGGDRDSTRSPGFGDNPGLLGVLPCIQQLMIKPIVAKQATQPFRCLYGSSADQYRSAKRMYLSDTLHHGMPLFVLRGIDPVRPALSFCRPVGRNA